MITLTSKALGKVKEIIAKSQSESGLRIAVIGGGCSGFQYQMSLEANPNPEDQVVEQEGLKVYIDPRSALYLNGIKIDYIEDDLKSTGFKFENPNASGSCGCGESFTV